MTFTLRGVVRARWRAFSVLGAASVSGGLLEAAFLVAVTRTGLAIANGETSVVATRDIELSVGRSIAVCVIIIVLRMLAAVSTVWLSARLTSSVTSEVRARLASAFLRASWSEQHGSRSGRLQELLTTFAQQGASLITGVASAVTAGLSLLALLVTAVVVDPAASLIVIGASLIIGLVLRPLRSAVRRQAKRTSVTGMTFATSLSEVSQLGMEMHVFGVQPQAEHRVNALVRTHEGTQRRLRFLQGLVPALYTGVAYLALVLALAVIAWLDRSDLSGVGAVMLIMLRSLSYGQAVQTSSAAINATRPFLDELDQELTRYRDARLVDGTRRVEAIMPLELDRVSFEYEADIPVLKDFSLSIDPCEVVGIVGPSGSGKSTLVQLLLGLRPPTSGAITARGVDIAQIQRAQWNRKVTFVPQQAHLIAGTVADNIRFLRDDVSDDDIVRAARLAHLHDDITKWEGGYERQVGELGSHLSGGQQQRLVIARALVERPELLILDEPTSALDVRSEALIRETLDELRHAMTIIIIAHRLSTLDSCDRIMVIQDGELKAFDTPTRLEETSTFYREALILSGLR